MFLNALKIITLKVQEIVVLYCLTGKINSYFNEFNVYNYFTQVDTNYSIYLHRSQFRLNFDFVKRKSMKNTVKGIKKRKNVSMS